MKGKGLIVAVCLCSR